jgi:hypothetical protein
LKQNKTAGGVVAEIKSDQKHPVETSSKRTPPPLTRRIESCRTADPSHPPLPRSRTMSLQSQPPYSAPLFASWPSPPT